MIKTFHVGHLPTCYMAFVINETLTFRPS